MNLLYFAGMAVGKIANFSRRTMSCPYMIIMQNIPIVHFCCAFCHDLCQLVVFVVRFEIFGIAIEIFE